MSGARLRVSVVGAAGNEVVRRNAKTHNPKVTSWVDSGKNFFEDINL